MSLDLTATIQCFVLKHNYNKINKINCDKICSGEAKEPVFASVVSNAIHLEGKGKGRPRTDHEGPEVEERYSSTISLTSALDGGGW